MRLIDANALAESDMAQLIDKYLYNQCNLTVGLAAALMPEIEAEPVRHGRWVSEKVRKPNWKGVDHDYFQPNSCSVCHTGFAVRTNFCPNCGAKMGEGE